MAKKEEALVKQQGNALTAVPEHLRGYVGDHRGSEHLTKDDIKMPRLSIAQKTSKQIERGDPKFIEGLEFGDLFNDLTCETYGRGPLYFTVVRADKPRGIEFYPLSEGGGVKDFDVPLNDPRMMWTTDRETGERNKPIATMFYDYILLLVPSMELVALSMKSTGLKVAKQLNSLIKLRGLPSFTGLYQLSVEIDKNDFGSFGVYKVQNAGWLDEDTCKFAEQVYEDLKDKQISIDRDVDVEEAEVVSDNLAF